MVRRSGFSNTARKIFLLAAVLLSAAFFHNNGRVVFAQYCNSFCVIDGQCQAGLVCSSNKCRNPSCPSQADCVCSPTATPTPTQTPTPTATPTPTQTPTPTPGNWYKMKYGSVYKNGSVSLSIPAAVNPFDSEDSTDEYLVAAVPGIVVANGSIDIYDPNPTIQFKTNTNSWQASGYSSFSRPLINNFYDYIKARKSYKTIASLDQIDEASKIYVITSDSLTINDDSVIAAHLPLALAVRNTADSDFGNVTINVNNFNSGGSGLAIFAKNISFGASVNSANGVFVGASVNFQNNTDGVKIKGNIASDQEITIPNRTDVSKPSLFVVLDMTQYFDLLPLISVSKYDFQQTQ